MAHSSGKKVNRSKKRPSLAEADLLESSLGYAIKRAQVYSFQEFNKYMRDLDVRPAQYALLVLILENPGIQQSAACSILNIEKANLTGLLIELVEAGLIHRTSILSDRRAYTLGVTPKGLKMIRAMMKRHALYEKYLAERLTGSERKLLLGLLRKIIPDDQTSSPQTVQ